MNLAREKDREKKIQKQPRTSINQSIINNKNQTNELGSE